MGPQGQRLFKQVRQQRAEAENNVANMLFPKCAKLKELCIGDYVQAEAVRDGNGGFQRVIWHTKERQTP
jgi:hypothetical protein